MGSQKGRQNMSWFTDNRVYLKARVYLWRARGIRGNAIIREMDKLIPNWRDEFIGEPGFRTIDNCLIQRGDKADRNGEFARNPHQQEIWNQAVSDEANNTMTHKFVVSPRKTESTTPPKSSLFNGQLTEDDLEFVRDLEISKDYTKQMVVVRDKWERLPLYRDSEMKMPPAKVKEILDNMIKGRRMPYSSLTQQAKNMVGMFCDAFLRVHA